MAQLIALVPIVNDGIDLLNFYPKYIGRGALPGRAWQATTYGYESWALVVVDNVAAAERTFIQDQPDTAVLPVNVDNQVGAALATVQAKLEMADIPAFWVTAGMSYRTVFRVVVRCLLLMDRFLFFGVATERLFDVVTLKQTVGDIPTDMRQRLTRAAESFSLSTAGITLATSVETALHDLGQQLLAYPCGLDAVL